MLVNVGVGVQYAMRAAYSTSAALRGLLAGFPFECGISPPEFRTAFLLISEIRLGLTDAVLFAEINKRSRNFFRECRTLPPEQQTEKREAHRVPPHTPARRFRDCLTSDNPIYKQIIPEMVILAGKHHKRNAEAALFF